MAEFGRDVLGKGVVICKDTPNFIGNRFFSVAASYGIERAFEQGYSIAEVDAINGTDDRTAENGYLPLAGPGRA